MRADSVCYGSAAIIHPQSVHVQPLVHIRAVDEASDDWHGTRIGKREVVWEDDLQ